jgi:protein-S-isoprenylcysteine O-methyltransferase Ste14
MFLIHFIMVLYLLLSPQRLGRTKTDKRSDPYFSVFNVLMAYAPIFGTQFWALLQRWSDPGKTFLIILGLILFFLGTGLRLYAIKTLGRFFTMEIGTRDGHRMITTGPYRFIRHPSYTGYFLMILGIGIAYQNIFSFIIPLLEITIFLVKRIILEEKMLSQEFGEEYSSYQQRTKKLLPWIY